MFKRWFDPKGFRLSPFSSNHPKILSQPQIFWGESTPSCECSGHGALLESQTSDGFQEVAGETLEAGNFTFGSVWVNLSSMLIRVFWKIQPKKVVFSSSGGTSVYSLTNWLAV